MAPSPSGAHQDAALEIASYLRTYIKLTGLGLVRIAPFDVVLSPKDVVQPDVLVVLNANLGKVKDLLMIGAPDLVVEVASPVLRLAIGIKNITCMLKLACQNTGLLTQMHVLWRYWRWKLVNTIR